MLFLSQFSRRGASSLRNSALEIPQKLKPSSLALDFIN
jgi:hypothetical protein